MSRAAECLRIALLAGYKASYPATSLQCKSSSATVSRDVENYSSFACSSALHSARYRITEKLLLLSALIWLLYTSGSYRNGLGVSSWDKMLAELMDHHNVETGTCSPDKCYVSADGKNRLMNVGDTFVFSDKPCLEYSCEVSVQLKL